MEIEDQNESPFNEVLRCAQQSFEDAIALPSSAYTSQEFLDKELETVFAQEWLCVGRVDRLKKKGDYFTCNIAGRSIIVLLDNQGEIRAMPNVCLHRMSELISGEGNTTRIVCPYHGWTYDLDGSLRGAPAMEQNTGFCKELYKLQRVRCEEWLGWIMITLNNSLPHVDLSLKAAHKVIGDYGLENYVEAFRETFRWKTNWKVLAENYMESYHLPVCHNGTVGGLSNFSEMDCPVGLENFNYHTFLKDDRLPIALAHESNTRMKGIRRRTTTVLNIYPSLYITLTPGYFWYLNLSPLGPGEVEVLFGGGLSPDFANSKSARKHFSELKELLDRVNLEDQGCVERVFRGLSSEYAVPGHLSHLERPLYDFYQYLAERTSGFARNLNRH